MMTLTSLTPPHCCACPSAARIESPIGIGCGSHCVQWFRYERGSGWLNELGRWI
jgi:hypothetical protein